MPRPYDPQATREALLKAAGELFARHGYAATKVEMIARRSRVNKAMINYHFGGKRKLYQSIVRESLLSALEQFQVLRRSNLPADQRLREFIRVFADVVARRPEFPAVIARELISGGANLDPRSLLLFMEVLAVEMEIIQQGVREGSFRPVNPIAAHVSLMGTLVLFYSTMAFRGRMLQAMNMGTIAPEEFVAHTQELFVRGLAETASSSSARLRKSSRSKPRTRP